MSARQLWVSLICILFFSRAAVGHFGYEETKIVPLPRLLANLEERRAKNTNDFQVTYQLAKVHSMAASTNLETMEARTSDGSPVFGFDAGVPRTVTPPPNPAARRIANQHLTKAIVLYERTIFLLKASTNLLEERWWIMPTQLGLAWCLDQAGQKQQALQAYRKALDVSWKIEVTGDFKIKEWLADVWSDVRAGNNPLHTRFRGEIGAGVCYSEEIIGYLLKLLDPVKDAAEIARLNQARQLLVSLPRAITPVLIPLLPGATDLDELVNPNAQVAFDLDGSGSETRWGWITPKAAWLVYDPQGTGKITSGLQFFGNVTFWVFWRDGYQALRALDDNGDGVLSGSELQGLALWTDRNGNGISDPGEITSVQEIGITAISWDRQPNAAGFPWSPSGVLFNDGTTRPSYDWIVPAESGPLIPRTRTREAPDGALESHELQQPLHGGHQVGLRRSWQRRSIYSPQGH